MGRKKLLKPLDARVYAALIKVNNNRHGYFPTKKSRTIVGVRLIKGELAIFLWQFLRFHPDFRADFQEIEEVPCSRFELGNSKHPAKEVTTSPGLAKWRFGSQNGIMVQVASASNTWT